MPTSAATATARRVASTIVLPGVFAGLLVLAAPATASAAPPTPRGPVGGCGAGFQLFSVEAISALFPLGAPVFAAEDSNRDGQVCVRFNPPQQGEGGVVEDNNAVGRG